MKLTTKIILVVIVPVLTVMGGFSYLLVVKIQETMEASLKNKLEGGAKSVVQITDVNRQKVVDIAKALARTRELPKALDRLDSRGVNQILNDQIAIYPFINYILVLESDSAIFAASTRTASGEKLNIEQLLMAKSSLNPIYPKDYRRNPVGVVGEDIYLKAVGLVGGLTQFVVVPIYRKGAEVGKILLSVKWESIHRKLLEEMVENLSASGNPISGIYLVDDKGEHLVGVSSNEGPLVQANILEGRSRLSVGDVEGAVIIQYDKFAAMKDIDAVVRFILIAMLMGAIVLSFILYLALEKNLLARVRILRDAMAAIGEDGGLRHKVPSLGNDELAGLSGSINTMVSQLLEKTTSVDQLNELVVSKNTLIDEKEKNDLALRRALQELDEQKFALDQHAIVAITDIKGTITYANDLFSKISGYEKSELIGSNHRLLKSGAHSGEFFRNMYLTVSRGDVWHGEICNRRKDGELYWVDTTIAPFMDASGKVKSYIAIRNDITTIKQAEKLMVEARVAAEESARIKSEFLASMSHEIRTPMNGVLGMLGILQKSTLDTAQERQLDLALTSAKSLLVIINDVLDFSKIESGKLEFESVEFDVRSMLDDFSESVALKAAEKGIEIVVDNTQLHSSFITSDPGRIRQIVTNLVGNAIKFTHNGEVIIRSAIAERNGQFILHCAVIDSGIGISKEKVGSLFNAFTQADSSTTRQYGGTGLGLSITKQLCELMGGQISVISELGRGSTFEFSIPVKKPARDSAVAQQISARNITVLVVEEHTVARQVLACQLREWGASVVEAASTTEGIAQLDQSLEDNKPGIDLAIVDVTQSEEDGLTLIEKVNSSRRAGELKFIAITDMAKLGDDKKLFKQGFHAVFPKPVITADLCQALSILPNAGDIFRDVPVPRKHQYFLESKSEENTRLVGGLRVLLVEDNAINQEVALSLLEDCDVDVAANGQEALSTLNTVGQESDYDVVLMDCQMPEMDGYAATRAIRAGVGGENNIQIPVIAMTANAMEGDKEKCLAAGMNDYLSKPIDPDDLIRMLSIWTPSAGKSRKSSGNQKGKTAGDFQVKCNDRGNNDEAVQGPSVLEDDAESKKMIWNQSEVLRRCGNKPERLKKLVSSFIASMPEDIARLVQALEENDVAALGFIGHGMKGVSGNLGAERFSESLREIERLAKGQGSASDFKMLVQKSSHEFELLRSEMVLFLGDGQASTGEN